MDRKWLENIGVKNGLLLAASLVGFGLLLYMVNKATFLNPTLRIAFTLVIPIFFMRKASIEQRKDQGGFINFSEALQPAYLCFIIGTIAFSVFQFTLMSVDHELVEIQRDIAVESLKSISDFADLSEESIANIEEMDTDELKPNLKSLLMSLAINFIFGFIIGAIIAAIVKRVNPESEQN